MDRFINVHEAKTQLSQILFQVALGEEFTIANHGVPVARLVPYSTTDCESDLARLPRRQIKKTTTTDDFYGLDENTMGLLEEE
ncbi:Antitoxin [Hyella patelloides LEGE 07179]|uniref:Antitoxin n=1 Tax=Hyella patelloides LEGE 07179 TaxID=945734 RepID=A0A563VWD0_9CYAN|nr:type II toxin-antitoxin system prevent-host-death family antitoxin [Hyella patelloides]VEP15697.1 Antitoxin [Hyella patelloides LEGE 07179]